MIPYIAIGILATVLTAIAAIAATATALDEDERSTAKIALALWIAVPFVWICWPLAVLAGIIWLMARLVMVATKGRY